MNNLDGQPPSGTTRQLAFITESKKNLSEPEGGHASGLMRKEYLFLSGTLGALPIVNAQSEKP